MQPAASLTSGRRLAILGRLDQVPRARVERELRRRGGRLLKSTDQKPELLVVAHGAHLLLRKGTLQGLLAQARAAGAVPVSENTLLRDLGLLARNEAPDAMLDGGTLARAAALDPATVELLVLFDVLEPAGGGFNLQHAATARLLARLLGRGAALQAVIAAALTLRRQAGGGAALAALPMAVSSGEIVLGYGESLAELDGQLRLPLGEARSPSRDELLAQAEQSFEAGLLTQAERLFRRAVDREPGNALLRFQLARVLRAAGRDEAARAELQMAVWADPTFADAWHDLSEIAEAGGETRFARHCLERTLAAEPQHAEAVYNLARSFFAAGEHAAALPLYARYLELDPCSEWARRAKRALLLCRLELTGCL